MRRNTIDGHRVREAQAASRGVTRAGFFGGAVGAAGSLLLPGLVQSASADASTDPPLPGLVPGNFLPASEPTQQLLGVQAFGIQAGYPQPAFTILTPTGPAGVLAFQHQRSAPGTGSDGFTVQLGSGVSAAHTINASATGPSTVKGSLIAQAGGHSFRADLTLQVAARDWELQPAYTLSAASMSFDGRTQTVPPFPNAFVTLPSESSDFDGMQALLNRFESASGSLGAQVVFDDPAFRVLATLAADPLLMAYEVLNPSFGVGQAGPWQLPSVFTCLDGRFVRLTPAAFTYWGIGCIAAIAGPAFDESNVKGFHASLG